ncbi:hypothetical protein ACHAWU_009215 [Discostella pseudostelligera]|uniref:Adhesin domain-containing protein n=1 Tax=Discostella pseudostelligera TaxID=259834 RepID=A0ABD3MHF4_9STRA
MMTPMILRIGIRPLARRYSCCFTITTRSADATQQRRCPNNVHHYSASALSSASTLITRIHLPTLGQNGTLHLIDNRTQQHVNDHRHRVHIVTSQGREDSSIDFVAPAATITSSSSNDVSTSNSMVNFTFDGELISSSSISNLTTSESSAITAATTMTTNTATLQSDNGMILQLINHVDGKQTSLGRVGPFMSITILEEIVSDEEKKEHMKNASPNLPPPMDIVIRIPQKFNISCIVSRGDLIVGGAEHDINNAYDDDNGKLEGDVHLRTSSGGNIVLHGKVRGHDIALESFNRVVGGVGDEGSIGSNGEKGRGVIHVRKSIEAGKVRIHTDSPTGRVRARMLKVGSSLSIDVSSSSPPSPPSRDHSSRATTKPNVSATNATLDDDDEGAIIDIGSVYIVSNGGGVDDNEARLNVNVIDDVGDDDYSNGLVRIKSSHGHVVVCARDGRRRIASPSSVQSASMKQLSPLIDLGGVNGSCDILLEASCISSSQGFDLTNEDNHSGNSDVISSTNDTRCRHHPDLRVHFDAMSPDSISTITSRRRGEVGESGDLLANSITMDRKLEAEVRLLTVPALHDHSDAHSLTQSDDTEIIQRTLMDIASRCNKMESKDDSDYFRRRKSIFIESNAYVDDWYNDSIREDKPKQLTTEHLSRRGIEYAHGTMANRSGEPDSRSDMRSSHRRFEDGGGGGKININGAASQALHGFRGKRQDNNAVDASAPTSNASPMPLLAVATDGIIKLETLSWFGSIARRYGLEEGTDGAAAVRGIGRQASRSPRLEK